jgi:Zn-dependent peptidase ImmA (M78 family)
MMRQLPRTSRSANIAIFAIQGYVAGMKPDEDALRGRVRQVVKETGLTHVQFADEIGLDADKLSKSLNGVRRFTSYELALIAERGRTTVDWLLTGAGPERLSAAARAQERCADSGLDLALQRARQVADVNGILQRLGVTSPALPPLPRVRVTGRAITDGPQLAEVTLGVLLQDATLDALRTDPASVIERALGINVLIEAFGDGFDGLACANSTFRLIVVNSRIPWTRQRFTLFHECGHILAGDGAGGDVCVDGDVMGEADRIEEMRANSFAAAVLMPEQDLRNELGCLKVTEHEFACLVGRYRVSPDALAWRLKTLGLIGTDERASLGAMPIQQAALIGSWSDEYAELTRTQSRPRPTMRLAIQAISAFVNGTISARPVADLLQVDSSTLWELRARVEDAGSVEANDDRAVFTP